MTHTIVITAADHEELTAAIAAAAKLSERGRAEAPAPEAELARAEIVEAKDLSPDIITMNSRAELLDLKSGERMEFTLVFPSDANIEADKISVLAPLGTAMLGYRVGDTFEWPVPYGIRHLKVIKSAFPARRMSPTGSLSRLAQTMSNGGLVVFRRQVIPVILIAWSLRLHSVVLSKRSNLSLSHKIPRR